MILIIKHVSIEGPGVIAEFFADSSWETRIVELEKGDRLPQDVSQLAAVIILGGPMNVYEEDKFSFLKQENAFIKKARAKEIPILGICLGAQLLAKAAGAEIRKMQKEEVGWCRIGLTEEGRKDLLFSNLNGELDVFQWHEDTFQLPDRAQLLAQASACRNQAFRLGKNAYGLQFHIEVTPDMVESWLKEYLDNGKQNKIINSQKILRDTFEKERAFTEQADKILLNFSRLLREEKKQTLKA